MSSLLQAAVAFENTLISQRVATRFVAGGKKLVGFHATNSFSSLGSATATARTS